jgi:hypothetical protein
MGYDGWLSRVYCTLTQTAKLLHSCTCGAIEIPFLNLTEISKYFDKIKSIKHLKLNHICYFLLCLRRSESFKNA